MKIHRYCRVFPALFVCLLLTVLLGVAPVSSQETEDSQMFLAGFNAFQQKNYAAAVSNLEQVLKKYPDTPLRDMTLFWLARAHYNQGNRTEAARQMARFTKEYPDSPLKNTVEEDLLVLAAKQQAPDQLEKAAEAERLAAAKAEEERKARERMVREAAEKVRVLKAKAEADRLAREKAEASRVAAAKAEEERLAKQKAEQEATEKARVLKAKADADRLAREKAEASRVAAAKAEEERLVKQKAEQEAAEKARVLRAKAEADRIAREKAEASRVAAAKTAEERKAAEKMRAERSAMKNKAIAEYQTVVERFPGTSAARTAAARLKELGVPVAPVQPVEQPSDTAQILSLEVAQYAALDFGVISPSEKVGAASKQIVPFEIINQGNGQDSFELSSGFPAEYGVRFAAASRPDQALAQTPLLMPGERFKGFVLLDVPPVTIDGLRISHPLKVSSRYAPNVSQSRVVSMVASAPLLRAVVKADKTQVLPGEKVSYRVSLLNVGSTAAQNVSLRLNYPAQYLPAGFEKTGLIQASNGVLVRDAISLKSGESLDLIVSFQLKDEALAKEELIVRAEVANNALQTSGTFLSNAVFVLPVSALDLKLAHHKLTAVPGQTLFVAAKITNKGNQRERFKFSYLPDQFKKVRLYQDNNRDGLLQPGEPEILTVGPLAPREEASLLLEVVTSANVPDGSAARLVIAAEQESGSGKRATAEVEVAYSRPVLQLVMKGREGRMVPGELITVELDIVNRGTNLARQVELQASWPQQMELVVSDLPTGMTAAGSARWQFNELGAGERRVVKVSFRVKPGTGVGTGLRLKSALSYQDGAGNRY